MDISSMWDEFRREGYERQDQAERQLEELHRQERNREYTQELERTFLSGPLASMDDALFHIWNLGGYGEQK